MAKKLIKAYSMTFLTDSSYETNRIIVDLARKHFGEEDLSVTSEDTPNYAEYCIYVENHTEEEFEKFADELFEHIEDIGDEGGIEDVSYSK